MDKLKGAWRWVRDHAVAILGAIAALLAVAWGIHYARRRIGGLRDRVAVEEARREIAADTARRDALIEQADGREADVEEIDARLAANHRRIVEAHEGTEGMADSEVEDAFARLGY